MLDDDDDFDDDVADDGFSVGVGGVAVVLGEASPQEVRILQERG